MIITSFDFSNLLVSYNLSIPINSISLQLKSGFSLTDLRTVSHDADYIVHWQLKGKCHSLEWHLQPFNCHGEISTKVYIGLSVNMMDDVLQDKVRTVYATMEGLR